MRRRSASRWLPLALWCAACAPGPAEPELQTTVFRGSTMGTYYVTQVVTSGLAEDQQSRLQAIIEGELEAVDGKMSTWKPDSEVSQFNRHRETTPFAVSAETFEVAAAAGDIWHLSGGALDATMGPLIDAWGFGSEGEVTDLGEAQIGELLEQIGFDQLTLDAESQSLSKALPDLSVNLSSIAKGYAVDRVHDALLAEGLDDVWVEVGGEVRASGRNAEGRVWRLGIERPVETPGGLQRIVPLDGAAVATSGDYRNYRERDGERFSHIIDPRNGWPIRHRLASVSVVHAQCMVADAWATALLVLGPDEGWELAERENLAVLMLVREGEDFAERMTPAFAARIAP
ncbi:MAG: FAD:protein FMN transferase [Acidobacteriota bacterium]